MALTNNREQILAMLDDELGQELISRTMVGSLPQILGGASYDTASSLTYAKIPKATFESEAWPMATVKVWSEQRNVGPNAPYPVIQYRIEAAGRFTEWMRNWDAIYQMASDLHDKLVAGLIADRQTDQPNWGRF